MHNVGKLFGTATFDFRYGFGRLSYSLGRRMTSPTSA